MKFKNIMIASVAVLALTACERVETGHVGIKVFLLGGEKGVDSEEVGVGRYWNGPNVEFYQFPTFTQNYVWTASLDEGSETDESISFQTREGMVVNADIGISYYISPDKVSDVFQKYRKGVDEITDIYLRNMVRDAINREASRLPIQSVYGEGKSDLLDAVQEKVTNEIADIGIVIEKIYWIGEMRIPEEVRASLNNKLKADQLSDQRENEIRATKAEAQKAREAAQGEADAILTVATAQAAANKLIAESLTPVLIQNKTIERWDGVLPRMTGEGAVPFIDVTSEISVENK